MKNPKRTKRISGPTPNGGDYSELYLFDKNGNEVFDDKKAVRGVVRECKSDGSIVFETFFDVGANSGGRN